MGTIAGQPVTAPDRRVLVLADSLLVGGLLFSIYAAASLRRCFGLAPEARELVTSGAYRLVRHPLYLGEFVAATGALLPVLAPLPMLIFGLFCLCLLPVPGHTRGARGAGAARRVPRIRRVSLRNPRPAAVAAPEIVGQRA
jgi:hypothetical protein